jgi:cation:H+ antiporter
MPLSIAAVVVGLLVLAWSADRFVHGAAAIAGHLGVSPLLIGLTVVGFGTSAPEILISVIAAVQGKPALAVGNALGSNIANIALIIGLTALVMPLTVRSQTLRREFPVLLGASMLVLFLCLDGHLGRIDGAVLLTGLSAMVFWIVHLGLQGREDDPLAAEFEQEMAAGPALRPGIAWTVVGLVSLVASSRLLVWGAVDIAHTLGVSDLVVGLTIVAIGTSLPELAASIASARKGEDDIAVGNIIGSNMFNLLAVMGIPAALAPAALEPAVLTRDLPVMLGLTVALLVMAYGFGGVGRINRFEGAILLVCFLAYQLLLYSSQR